MGICGTSGSQLFLVGDPQNRVNTIGDPNTVEALATQSEFSRPIEKNLHKRTNLMNKTFKN